MTLDRDAADGRDPRRAWPSRSGWSCTRPPRRSSTVANANMADAVRLISIRRGYDPREFALVVLRRRRPAARRRAREGAVDPDRARAAQPGHRRPRSAACWSTSATTCSTMYLGTADDARPRRARARRSRGWRTEARERMRRRGRRRTTASSSQRDDRHALCRPVALARGAGRRPRRVARRRRRAASTPSTSASTPTAATAAPVEIYRLNLRAIGVTREGRAAARDEAGGAMPEPVETPAVWFDGRGRPVDTPVYRARRPPGGRRASTARRSSSSSTRPSLVPPGVRAEVDEWLNIRMTIDGGGVMTPSRGPHPRSRSRSRCSRTRSSTDRRPDGRADPAHLPLVRHLLARLLVRAVRRRRATRSCRAARTSPCTSARCTTAQGGGRGVRRRHRPRATSSRSTTRTSAARTSTTCGSCGRSSTTGELIASRSPTGTGPTSAAACRARSTSPRKRALRRGRPDPAGAHLRRGRVPRATSSRMIVSNTRAPDDAEGDCLAQVEATAGGRARDPAPVREVRPRHRRDRVRRRCRTTSSA